MYNTPPPVCIYVVTSNEFTFVDLRIRMKEKGCDGKNGFENGFENEFVDKNGFENRFENEFENGF